MAEVSEKRPSKICLIRAGLEILVHSLSRIHYKFWILYRSPLNLPFSNSPFTGVLCVSTEPEATHETELCCNRESQASV